MRTRTALVIGVLVLVSLSPGCEDSPAEPSPVCTFTIAPASLSFTEDGGNGAIAITASFQTCAWTASSGASWVTLSATAGTGSGTLAYQVASNGSADARTTTVAVAGQSHAVSQAGRPGSACMYEIAPMSATYGDAGGSGTFAVTAPDGCGWTATREAGWIAITGGATGSGSGTVAYTVAENNSTESRSATIVAAGRTFTVTQLGEAVDCQYSVAPVDFAPCMPAGTRQATVTAPTGCTWTASVNVPWLTITGGDTGSGTGQVTFSFTSNYHTPRDGIIMVRWPTPTAGQNVRVAQAGCTYAVSQSTFDVAAGGGNASFFVLQQSVPLQCGGALQDACVWSAISDVPWITITSSMPRQGDNPVAFTVAPNLTGAPRTGTITVRDKVVRVSQAGS